MRGVLESMMDRLSSFADGSNNATASDTTAFTNVRNREKENNNAIQHVSTFYICLLLLGKYEDK